MECKIFLYIFIHSNTQETFKFSPASYVTKNVSMEGKKFEKFTALKLSVPKK